MEKSYDIAFIARETKDLYRTDAKNIKLEKKSVTLKVRKTEQIKAKIIKRDESKLILDYANEFRYATSNSKVATVDKNGKIKAVGKGTCTVYVYAINGFEKKVSV